MLMENLFYEATIGDWENVRGMEIKFKILDIFCIFLQRYSK